jgi:hypothetical protein
MERNVSSFLADPPPTQIYKSFAYSALHSRQEFWGTSKMLERRRGTKVCHFVEIKWNLALWNQGKRPESLA